MKLKFALMLLLFVAAGTLHARQVVVYNWSEYIPDGVLEKFTEETGIQVRYSTYESNEAMHAKLQLQRGQGYDVVVPSTYYIAKMRKEGLLQPINKELLSNFTHLNQKLLNKPYDPGNQYSVPYLWGSTGIGVNSRRIKVNTITGWESLWDPKWKGRLLLTDDVRDVFHMALRINGHSGNSTDPEEIRLAYEKLKELMPNVLTYNSDAPREPFLSGDVSLGMLWNGEAIMAREENNNIRYLYPKEGAVFWVDSFAIPKGAENVAEAHEFINFMLRPEIAKLCVEEIGYATPNQGALKLLSYGTRNNKIIFPDAETIDNGEFQDDVGDAIQLYHHYWERLKTGR